MVINMNISKIDKNMDITKFSCKNIIWFNVESNFKVQGKINSALSFSRLNADININDNIKFLAQHPSGLYVDFTTNSTSINLHVKTSSSGYMPHMSAIGQIGLDLYYKYNNKYIFVATTKTNEKEYLITLLKDLPIEAKSFRLYLPLYVALEKLEIGIDSSSTIKSVPTINQNKIVCYGTSITQGGCATRPGMSYPSILGRLIDFEIINLGFSGNCHLNLEIADEINKIHNLKYLIIEAEANLYDPNIIKKKLPSFLNIMLSKNINLKIILITHFPIALSLLYSKTKIERSDAFRIQKDLSEEYNIYFISGRDILKEYSFDESVDGIHLTDLGFYKIATYLKDYINNLEG